MFQISVSVQGTLTVLLQEAGLTVDNRTVERPEHFIGRIEVAPPS